ncbi:uncharacterized protein LOC112555372 [Pomacea canaliculata]|uniref:uncharacterized protein LOC112555372 n=1 Tax=Pomacea canaliculata TaxID=400727 RepID=UPI000D73716E|nr:uncharacterized protein LOC112555372 [Pomacea canaliculata]
MMCTPGTVMLLMLLRLSKGVFLASETCSQSGWFGPKCVYKCHCQNDSLDKTPCDFAQGTCAEGSRCEDGYTGASCQYSYLAFCRSSSLVSCEGDQDSSLAVDGKDATCITLRAMGSRDCSWSVNLTSASFVTQISVKIPPGEFTGDISNALLE